MLILLSQRNSSDRKVKKHIRQCVPELTRTLVWCTTTLTLTPDPWPLWPVHSPPHHLLWALVINVSSFIVIICVIILILVVPRSETFLVLVTELILINTGASSLLIVPADLLQLWMVMLVRVCCCAADLSIPSVLSWWCLSFLGLGSVNMLLLF